MKISIVTITFNNAKGLDNTLSSIAALKIPKVAELECVIVDGASTDNTHEIVEKYVDNNRVTFLYKSEPDKGIYDAMNKGIDRVTGDWVIFMNAGDCFFSENAIEQLIPHLVPEYDIVYGDVVRCYKGRYQLACSTDTLDAQVRISMPVFHQACVYAVETIKKEKYNTKYKIAGDYDQIARLYVLNKRFYHVSVVISLFEYGGISVLNCEKAQLEDLSIQREYLLITSSKYRKLYRRRKIEYDLLMLLPREWYEKRRERQFDNATANWVRELDKVIPEWYHNPMRS